MHLLTILLTFWLSIAVVTGRSHSSKLNVADESQVELSARPRRGCRKMLVVGHAGETHCERQCASGGRQASVKCLRLRTASRFHICPDSCCRLGDSCRQRLVRS